MNAPTPNPAGSTHRHSTVTTRNADGSETTTETRVVETTRTNVGQGATQAAPDPVGYTDRFSPDESGAHPQGGYTVNVGEIPPVEQIVLQTVLEGVGILQKGAEYVRRVSGIASLIFRKKE